MYWNVASCKCKTFLTRRRFPDGNGGAKPGCCFIKGNIKGEEDVAI